MLVYEPYSMYTDGFRKKKRRRTRPGLRRYVAQQGVSYHQQRTAVLAANSGQVRDDHEIDCGKGLPPKNIK